MKTRLIIMILAAFLLVAPTFGYTVLSDYTLPTTASKAAISSLKYNSTSGETDFYNNITKIYWEGPCFANDYGSMLPVTNSNLYVGTTIDTNYNANVTLVYSGTSGIYRNATTCSLSLKFSNKSTPGSATTGIYYLSNKTSWFPNGLQLYYDDPSSWIIGRNQALFGSASPKYGGHYIIYGGTAVDPTDADFTCTPLSGTPPKTVSCTDTSTNTPTSWAWELHHESGANSSILTTRNISINLYDTGYYNVSLTTTNEAGSDTEVKENYIQLTNWTTPTPTPTPGIWGSPGADFYGTPLSSSHAPLTVYFTDQSTNGPSSWLWEFGDGWGSTVKNPSHTYASAGTYTVSLTASNGWGSDQETKASYVTIAANDTPEPPAGMGYVKGHTYTAGDFNSLVGSATVSLYNDTWSDTTTSSDADGYYKFEDVAAGSYHVNGTKANYTASTDYVITVYDGLATTQDIALTANATNATVTPTPTQLVVYGHMVRFTFRDINDNPFVGLNVTATMQESTSPWSWLAQTFGFTSNEDPKNITLSGSTGSDGSWSALMIPNVRYEMKAWTANNSVNMTWSLYPQETDYLYIIQDDRTPDLGDSVFFNLTHTRISSSTVRLNWYYNDTLVETGEFRYWLINQTDPENSTYIINTTTTGHNFNLNYDIADTLKGAQYVWGFEANHTRFGEIEKNAGITLPGGGNKRLVEIGLNDDEYLWFCLTLIVILTALFSSYRKVMLGCIVVPLFSGMLWYIGWFDMSFAIFITALVIGVMAYMLNREIRTGI